MALEHTAEADSQTFFEASNYGTRTTSEIEWWFVVDPDHGLERLGRQRWAV